MIFTLYAFCNLDDVSWGNRPDLHQPDPELVRRNNEVKNRYRNFRTNLLFFWLMLNIGLYFMYDCMVLAIYKNHNEDLKVFVFAIMKYYSIWLTFNALWVFFFSGLHHFNTFFLQTCFTKYGAYIIKKKPKYGTEEYQALLNQEEIEVENEKQHNLKNKQKNTPDLETQENEPSFFSDDVEAAEFVQYKQQMYKK